MQTHKCPHCHTGVPHGATVCTGCQAEVEYGAPSFAIGALAVASGLLGIQASRWVGSNWVGWVLGLMALAGGGVLLSRLFSWRVVFKRYYRS